MLSGDDIRLAGLLASGQGLFQPNGVDLSVDAVWRLSGPGSLGRSNVDRSLPDRELLSFDAEGWLHLQHGGYLVRYAETVQVPQDCGGLCFPRSSLLRMGAYIPTAVWDAGYVGRGEGWLEVRNPNGLRLQHGARIVQLVVFRLSAAATAGYAGAYQERRSGS